ncbi:hypothetical protein FNW02_29045 [Komarekiella sp. 'clone 1']|uniref:Uncharacterized protein n=1 Tax=Komarekiella delphini-convector SJRDD-AB1 TaxID=2593771 RepID=A0AA40T2Z3_9NOST|nr:hypothetical protein [Komarekiella delphini-convector]MBD6619753.1 hypothetical protein [Komarekiella delphini-convector SJRDD-AB1]
MDKPILEKDGMKSEFGINVTWYAAVHSHPLNKGKYSYAIATHNVLERNLFPLADFDSCLFGCYDTPRQALNAGVEEAQNRASDFGKNIR